MASPEREKIAKFFIESEGSTNSSAYEHYTHAADLKEVASGQKPAAMFYLRNAEDAEKIEGFIIGNLSELSVDRYGTNVIVSRDSEKVEGLKSLLSEPQTPDSRKELGLMLGIPEKAVDAFVDPGYNLYDVVIRHGYLEKKEFDHDAPCFAGYMPSSLDDPEFLESGRRRRDLLEEMFGHDTVGRYVESFRKTVIDIPALLASYTFDQ